MKDAKSKTILVTGASSGIGRACVLRLAKEGFRIFAGVRKPADANALASPDIHPVVLDVTDREGIQKAANEVKSEVANGGLYGLVNNAGIGDPGPIEYVSLEDVKHQFDVNVFGQIAVTQAFLPLIRQAQGRIINIGSVGDRITMPFGGVLCGSKSAFASLTEALRLELRPWGIYVCLIEPAMIATPGVDKTSAEGQKLLASLPPEGIRQYGNAFQTFMDIAIRREKGGSSPDVVAYAVLKALTAASPKTRYLVGKNAMLLTRLARLPDALLDRLRLRIFHLPGEFGALSGRG